MSNKKVTFSWAFKEFIWPRKNIIFMGLGLIVLRSLSSLILPYASKTMLDDIIPAHDISALKILLITVSAAIIVQAVTSFALTKLLSVEAQHLIYLLRAKVQRKLLSLPINFLITINLGHW